MTTCVDHWVIAEQTKLLSVIFVCWEGTVYEGGLSCFRSAPQTYPVQPRILIDVRKWGAGGLFTSVQLCVSCLTMFRHHAWCASYQGDHQCLEEHQHTHHFGPTHAGHRPGDGPCCQGAHWKDSSRRGACLDEVLWDQKLLNIYSCIIRKKLEKWVVEMQFSYIFNVKASSFLLSVHFFCLFFYFTLLPSFCFRFLLSFVISSLHLFLFLSLFCPFIVSFSAAFLSFIFIPFLSISFCSYLSLCLYSILFPVYLSSPPLSLMYFFSFSLHSHFFSFAISRSSFLCYSYFHSISFANTVSPCLRCRSL